MSNNKVVPLTRPGCLHTEQDELLKRVYEARNEECQEKASWLMMDALASMDAHFRIYHKHYKQ